MTTMVALQRTDYTTVQTTDDDRLGQDAGRRENGRAPSGKTTRALKAEVTDCRCGPRGKVGQIISLWLWA